MASNHDISRFPTRWAGGDEGRARLALLVLATLPGTTTLYYGDEIAMTDVPVPPSLRRDRMTPGVAGGVGRDAQRTPMQWDASPSAGFTAEGVTPWLPFGGNAARNVAGQRDDPGSTLRLARDLLALRRTAFAGQVAGYERLPAPPGVWSYRSGPLMVTANFTGRGVRLPGSTGEVLITTGPGTEPGGELGPWQGLITRAARERAE
jgi:glycosidase